jgi:hypothetical protein
VEKESLRRITRLTRSLLVKSNACHCCSHANQMSHEDKDDEPVFMILEKIDLDFGFPRDPIDIARHICIS